MERLLCLLVTFFIKGGLILLETIFSAFLCIVSAFIFYSSTQFNMAFIGDSGLGPDFFPKVIAIILFILSGMLFIGSLRNKNKKSYVELKIYFNSTWLLLFHIILMLF